MSTRPRRRKPFGCPNFASSLFEHAVVVGDVVRRQGAQLLARLALEQEAHAAELVELVEIRRQLPRFLVARRPVRAELVDDRCSTTASFSSPKRNPWPSMTYSESTYMPPPSKVLRSRSSVAWKSQPSTAPDIVGPGGRDRHAMEFRLLLDGAHPGGADADGLPPAGGRTSLRRSPHLWPANPSGGTYFTLLRFVDGVSGRRRKQGQGEDPQNQAGWFSSWRAF